MEKPYSAALDLYWSGVKITNIVYDSGDSGVYPLFVRLKSRGEPFAFPDGSSVEFNFKTPAGELFTRGGSVRDGAAFYEFSPADLAVPGVMTAAVAVVSGERRLTWPGFAFYVGKSLYAYSGAVVGRMIVGRAVLPPYGYTGAQTARALVGSAILGTE